MIGASLCVWDSYTSEVQKKLPPTAVSTAGFQPAPVSSPESWIKARAHRRSACSNPCAGRTSNGSTLSRRRRDCG
eukprot:5805815-Prymnesium_polylepis.1